MKDEQIKQEALKEAALKDEKLEDVAGGYCAGDRSKKCSKCNRYNSFSRSVCQYCGTKLS